MQADSGSDSDSESRNKNEEIIPVNLLTQTVWIAPPTKDILCADWRQLSESELEPECACTIRVPLIKQKSQSRLHLTCDFTGVSDIYSGQRLSLLGLRAVSEHVCVERQISSYYKAVSTYCVVYIACGRMSSVYFCLIAVWGYWWIR